MTARAYEDQNMIKQFIESIREEKEGFSFDQPWRLEEKSLGVIVPILRKSEKKRGYILLAEAKNIKIEDTGSIDYVYVKNDEEEPVLISRGEIFRGKTQERAAIHDHIIMPGKGLRVAVRCVHASKGIRSSAEMAYGGRTPYTIDLSGQQKTWNTVANYHCTTRSFLANSNYVVWGNTAVTPQDEMTITSIGGIHIPNTGPVSFDGNANYVPMDDLVGTLDGLSDAIREAMKKIPPIENQVGAVFFKENDLIGMDVYDLPLSWEAVKNDVVEKEGASFLNKDDDSMFQFHPDKAKVLVQKRLGVEFEEKELYGKEYRLVELKNDKLVGEAIEFNGQIIHLTLWKKN